MTTGEDELDSLGVAGDRQDSWAVVVVGQLLLLLNDIDGCCCARHTLRRLLVGRLLAHQVVVGKGTTRIQIDAFKTVVDLVEVGRGLVARRPCLLCLFGLLVHLLIVLELRWLLRWWWWHCGLVGWRCVVDRLNGGSLS